MAPGVAISLKRLAWRHRKKLCITFMLVIAENVAFLLYPVLAGMAINAILGGQTSHAALYGLMVLFMWCMGAARRSVDTRTGLAPIFPYTFYHLTHYWFAAADIPVANDTPVHYADAIRCNVRRPPRGSLPLLTRRALA